MTDRERFDLIDRYFRGELSEDEMEFFNSKWATDNQFAEEVANHEAVNELMIDAGLLDIKRKMKDIHHSHVNGKKNGKYVKGSLIGTIALVAVLMGGWYFLDNNSSNNNKKQPTKANKEITAQKQDNSPSSKEAEDEDKNEKDLYSVNRKVSGSPSNDPFNSENNRKRRENVNISNNRNNTDDRPREDLSSLSYGDKRYFEKYGFDWGKDNNRQIYAPRNSIDSISTPTYHDYPSKPPHCIGIQITANYKIIKTCKDKNKGKIILDKQSITGGEGPYKFSLRNKDDYSSDPVFSNLKRGYYTVEIRDTNNCPGIIKNIYVPDRDCQSNSFVFVPEKEEAWSFPFKNKPNGKLTIYNKNGRKVLQKEIRGGTPSKWKGQSQSGQQLPMGLYHVVFEQSGNITKVWNLTIIR